MPTRRPAAGYAALAAAVLLFSTIEVAAKWIGGTVPPLRLAALRFLAAGLALLPFAVHGVVRSGRRWTRQDAILLGGLAVIGVTVLSGLYHVSLTYLPANVGAILFSGNPVFVAVLAPWLLHERLDPRRRAALALGAAGVALFLWDRGQFSTRMAAGVALMLGAMFVFALYTVLSKRVLARYGAIPLTCAACILGSLALLPVAWWREGMPFRPLPLPTLGAVAYLALATTSLAYALYFAGLKRVQASRGSLLFFIKPVAAAGLAYVVLGECMTAPMIAGAALIVAGTALALWPDGGARGKAPTC